MTTQLTQAAPVPQRTRVLFYEAPDDAEPTHSDDFLVARAFDAFSVWHIESVCVEQAVSPTQRVQHYITSVALTSRLSPSMIQIGFVTVPELRREEAQDGVVWWVSLPGRPFSISFAADGSSIESRWQPDEFEMLAEALGVERRLADVVRSQAPRYHKLWMERLWRQIHANTGVDAPADTSGHWLRLGMAMDVVAPFAKPPAQHAQ